MEKNRCVLSHSSCSHPSKLNPFSIGLPGRVKLILHLVFVCFSYGPDYHRLARATAYHIGQDFLPIIRWPKNGGPGGLTRLFISGPT